MKIRRIEVLESEERFIQHIPAGTTKVVEGIKIKNNNPTSFPDIDFDVSGPMKLEIVGQGHLKVIRHSIHRSQRSHISYGCRGYTKG
jgi:hypothetical protein